MQGEAAACFGATPSCAAGKRPIAVPSLCLGSSCSWLVANHPGRWAQGSTTTGLSICSSQACPGRDGSSRSPAGAQPEGGRPGLSVQRKKVELQEAKGCSEPGQEASLGTSAPALCARPQSQGEGTYREENGTRGRTVPRKVLSTGHRSYCLYGTVWVSHINNPHIR